MIQPWARSVIVMFLLLVAGCTGRTPVSRYAESEGYEARLSPDGLSVFRRLCEEENRSTMRLGNLSEKAAERLDTIVWSPKTLDWHEEPTLTWMREWLRRGNKTLIYVGRDYSAYADYWSECARDHWSQPESFADREKGRACYEIAATSQAELAAMRYAHRDVQILPWCQVDNTKQRAATVESFVGGWALELAGLEHRIVVRGFLSPLSSVDLPAMEIALDAVVKQKAGATTTKPVLNPLTPMRSFASRLSSITDEDEANLRRIRAYREEGLDSEEPEVWLESADGVPLLTSVAAEPDSSSRVVLVSTPSLLANYNLTYPGNWRIAEKLVGHLPPGKIGFLSTDGDPRVLQAGESEQQKGFEMLTMWPINIITLHAAFLGMLVLVALFPIFGRPKSLPAKTTQDFSDHIEALGALLFKSGDRFYALSTIADYFRSVRKDIHSPWAKCEEVEPMSVESPFRSDQPNPSGSSPATHE
ncbi:hypothetical protein VN12_14410 [Pirellula sp. SH-Sr6A]|uniref:hypothetical protein n=1 Tax=Pirellula sp. SH-Sr6A TaxID=1632865 RepID=UPI00078B7C28|nr:hypothetical protein [Pirellula sp. SH-Sr6A]AMV33316.1 hypothetical protein VN12_14410 [Pirellula sp. SH-Sr6A]